MNTLQRILTSIEGTLESGAPGLESVLMGFTALFLLFALVMTAYGMVHNGRVMWAGCGLLIRLSLVYFALTRWSWFLGGLRDLGVFLGLLVTGGQLHVGEFLDPGALLQKGMRSAAVLWSTYQSYTGVTQVFTAFPYLLAWVAYCAAFAVMAYKVFWWQTELMLAAVAGTCLLPFAILRQTSFVVTGVLSYAANAFARFLLGAMLAGAMWKHLDMFAVSSTLSRADGTLVAMQAASAAVAMAWVLAACFLAVNRLAGMLTSGIPGMAGGQSLGSLARMAATGAAAVGTVGGAAVVGGMAAAGGARAGVQAMATGGGGLSGLKETARATYAGVQAGAHGQNLGRLTTLMRGADPTNAVGAAAQLTLRQAMQASRHQHDQTHHGARHHP